MKNKIDLVRDCFSMLLRTGVTIEATPDDDRLALNRLEDMMAELESRNLATGYNFEDAPQPDSPSGLENWMNLAISESLAVRVWTDFSPEAVNPRLEVSARQSISNLSARLAQVNAVRYAKRTPLGSGNQPYQQYNKFFGNIGSSCDTSGSFTGGCSPTPYPPAPPSCSCDIIPLSHLKLLGDVALFGASEKQYSVAGFYDGWSALASPPDGGGLFVYSQYDSKANHNGVTVYAPEAIQAWNGTKADIATLLNWTGVGVGVFIRVISDFVTPEMAGAVRDGTSDDTLPIQAAINQTVASALVFGNGAYIAENISFPRSMQISGCGVDSVLKQKSLSNRHFIQPSASGVTLTFRDMVIDQNNSQQTTGSGLFLYNSTVSNHIVDFDFVTIRNFCEGAIRIVGDRNDATREILNVRNCRFTGGTESESGIYNTFTIFAADASEINVLDSDFDHGLTLSKQGIPAISIAGTVTPSEKYTEVTIRNNKFNGYGRFTAGSGIGVIDAYVWADKVDISGNKFKNSWTVPIRAKANAKNMVIHGNIMDDFNNPGTASMNGGISIVSATLPPTVGRYVISDNIIDGSVYRGIEVSDGGSNPESIIVSGNIINAPADIGIYMLGCKGFSVYGNNIKGTGQQGVAFSACQGTCIIDDNIIDTTALAGIQSVGSQLSLDVQMHGNNITASTASGITVENVRLLSLQGNRVQDVVLSGSQRGYRVGGSTGIEVGQVKDNLAIGAFATAQFSIITAGFTSALYESGNSWNYQERYLPAAPTTGTWARGDKVWNTAPAASGNIGWVCVTAGTPGTWKTFGAIAA